MRAAPGRSAAAYQRPPADDGALVERHRAMLDRVTRRVAMRCGGAVAAGDLFAAAALGLIHAAQRFDPSRDVSFETFAEHRVRGAVLDELRALDNLPRRLRHDTEAVRRAAAKLEQELGREASADELAAQTGHTVEEVTSLQQLARPPEPLTELLAGTLQSPTTSAEQALLDKERALRLSAAIGTLAARTQQLLQMHYVDGLTYREIGEVLEVSEVRICQLHKGALAALGAELRREES